MCIGVAGGRACLVGNREPQFDGVHGTQVERTGADFGAPHSNVSELDLEISDFDMLNEPPDGNWPGRFGRY